MRVKMSAQWPGGGHPGVVAAARSRGGSRRGVKGAVRRHASTAQRVRASAVDSRAPQHAAADN